MISTNDQHQPAELKEGQNIFTAETAEEKENPEISSLAGICFPAQ